MELILSRHGNTFDPGQPVVWAGTSNDLPLVRKGIEQAERLAAAMIRARITLAAVYCSPLQRTKKYASLIMERMSLEGSPIIDPRINEIDYGGWTGLTDDQVRDRFGEEALRGWNEQCRWPEQGSWGSTEAIALSEVRSFVSELSEKYSGHVLVVTSNGRLRYFLKLASDEFEKRLREKTFKVKTGNICKLTRDKNSELIRVSYWDEDPSKLQRL